MDLIYRRSIFAWTSIIYWSYIKVQLSSILIQEAKESNAGKSEQRCKVLFFSLFTFFFLHKKKTGDQEIDSLIGCMQFKIRNYTVVRVWS